jgi:hypothetical protein
MLIQDLDALLLPSLGTGYLVQRAGRSAQRAQVVVREEVTHVGCRAPSKYASFARLRGKVRGRLL